MARRSRRGCNAGCDRLVPDVARLMTRGAPVRWKALEPTFGRASGVALSRNAPHRNAALLFADFILSREGQEIIRQGERIPSNVSVQSPLDEVPLRLIDPGVLHDEGDPWDKLRTGPFPEKPAGREGRAAAARA
jgi:iron(III) transport system substrate-binding protein